MTYVVYPDEGHGFARPENNIAFKAIMEAFLARHLGGRAEPIGDDFTGSSQRFVPVVKSCRESLLISLHRGRDIRRLLVVTRDVASKWLAPHRTPT